MEQQRSSLGDRTRELTSQAQQKAGEQVRSGIDSGKRRAAGALAGVADSLLHGSDETADGAARYIRQAGEQVQRAADWLEHADVNELTNRTEEFARRQPVAFIGGAFALGLIAARFIKSSRRSQFADMPGNEAWGNSPSDSARAGMSGGFAASAMGDTGIGAAGGGAYTGGHADLPGRGTTGGTSGLSGTGGSSTGAGASGSGMTGSESTAGWTDVGEVGRDR
jgi:hypothetical protein